MIHLKFASLQDHMGGKPSPRLGNLSAMLSRPPPLLKVARIGKYGHIHVEYDSVPAFPVKLSVAYFLDAPIHFGPGLPCLDRDRLHVEVFSRPSVMNRRPADAPAAPSVDLPSLKGLGYPGISRVHL